ISRSRLLIIILCLISLLWNSYIFFVTKTQKLPHSKRTICATMNDHWFVMNVINYADSMITLAVPFLIIAVLNVSISRTVMRRRSMCQNTVVAMLRYVTFSANLATGDRRCSAIEQNLENRKKDEKVTKTLLLISMVFLLMNLPDHVLRVLVSFLNDNGRWAVKNQYVICGLIQGQMISTLLFHTNFAINFILYSVAGDNFRTHMTGFCRQVWHKWSSKRNRAESDARKFTLKSGQFIYSYQSTAHSIAIGRGAMHFV
uniref:G-protein coupled receptors family 1 profile domain-containing protein n=1 Tax=Romanomermis culicivorax TaxID=13658 RepID=A0A915IH38_ROMCU